MGLHSNYGDKYSERDMMYPAEDVIRIFKRSYPEHSFQEDDFEDSSILDLGCGDGRHLVFLNNDLGFDAYGIEPTERLANIAQENVDATGADAVVRAGTNIDIPFDDDEFDYLLAWNSCYYMGEEHSSDFEKHVQEYTRVLKQEGSIVPSIPKPTSFIYQGGETPQGGYRTVKDDLFGTRDGTVLRRFDDADEIIDAFSPYFGDFVTTSIHDDFFGYNYHWWLLIGDNIGGS